MATPTFINAGSIGDTATSSATVLVFTTGADASYLIVKCASMSGAGGGGASVASIAAVPTGGGSTLNLAQLGVQADQTPRLRSEIWGVAGCLPNQEYTITVTWSGNNSNATVEACAYKDVDHIGTAGGAQSIGAGATLSANVDGTGALVVDLFAVNADTTLTPDGSQTAEIAKFGDGAAQVSQRSSYKTGSGTTTMAWTAGSSGQRRVLLIVPLVGASAPTFQAAWAKGANALLGGGRTA